MVVSIYLPEAVTKQLAAEYLRDDATWGIPPAEGRQLLDDAPTAADQASDALDALTGSLLEIAGIASAENDAIIGQSYERMNRIQAAATVLQPRIGRRSAHASSASRNH